MMRSYCVRGMVLSMTAAMVTAVGCGQPETFDREQMLEDTADGPIRSTHEKLGQRADTLQSAVESYCEGEPTSESLESARQAWMELQGPLKHIQAWSFQMSPYRGASFDTPIYKIDREPADGETIETELAEADGEIDEQFIAEQDYTKSAKGFPAVEYLLFGDPEGEGTLSSYQGDGTNSERRCDYLVAATSRAHGITDGYIEAWSPDGGDFTGMFASSTSETMNWTTLQDSINAMVSQMVFVSKTRLSKNLLGGPLGQHSDNAYVPDRVSSPYADASLAQLEATLGGLEKLYDGSGGKSLADYTKFRKQSVHELVRDRIDAAKSAIDEIPEPLERATEENPEKVEAAQQAIDELTSTIEADLKTSLGASTTRVVVDND